MKPFGLTLVLFTVISLSTACSDDKPASQASSGGENVFQTTEKNVNQAQRDFQAGLQEERRFVDEKANKAAAEGRKAARKVGDALSGGDADPEPGKS